MKRIVLSALGICIMCFIGMCCVAFHMYVFGLKMLMMKNY